ncbi:alpha/beta hydrolase [Caulobacter sp.]|uniref:alpha/beta hydrolase fold domain-containing protein n=1 Tax=Caulobacter sp. TaxID=78 RepID=UPI0016168BEF
MQARIAGLSLSLLLLATAGAASAQSSAPAPFTVERVLGEMRTAGIAVSVPADPPAGAIKASEDVEYLRRGAEVLRLDIYRPSAAGPRPAVLILHGGGWESGTRQMERGLAKALAARGFIAIPVSYRLGASGRFPGAVHDVKAAVRWVRANAKRFDIDPDFIAIAGGSAGGHLAALVGASNGVASLEDGAAFDAKASAVQAMVDIDGAASFPDAALIAQEQKRQGATSRFLGGNYVQRRETWFAASPLTYVSPASAPSLFFATNGKSPILPGRVEMAARLQALGLAAEVQDLPAGTPHPFWLLEPWFTPLVGEIATFLDARYKATKP